MSKGCVFLARCFDLINTSGRCATPQAPINVVLAAQGMDVARGVVPKRAYLIAARLAIGRAFLASWLRFFGAEQGSASSWCSASASYGTSCSRALWVRGAALNHDRI